MPDPAVFTRILLQKLTEACTVDELLAEAARIGCLFTSEASLFLALTPKQLSAQLRGVLPGFICCCYQDIMILLGPGDLPHSPQKDTRIRLRHWLNYHRFQIAASMPFAALDGAANGYRQARELVQAGRTLAAAEPPLPALFYYEDYLPICACLSAYGSEAPAQHIHPHIARLAAHDKEHGTQYLHTLEA